MNLTVPGALILCSLVAGGSLGVFGPMVAALLGVLLTWGLLATVDRLTERRR